MTKWELVKDFVNSHEFFTKAEMRKELNIIGSSNYTESQYILLMMNSEFLKRKSRGKYERVCKVPNNMSTNQIQKLAYDAEKRTKFFRKEKLKNLQFIENSTK